MQNLQNIFDNIYKNDIWNMGQNESKSGLGSSNEYTINIRNKLIDFIKDKSINKLLDTSCGDWNWMKYIKNNLPNYIGLDIVKDIVDKNNELYSNNNIKFIHTDFLSYIKILEDKSIDLILCRHTLEHLPTEYSIEVVREIRRVSKRALITSNTHQGNSSIQPNGSNARVINLEKDEYHTILGDAFSKHWDSIGEQPVSNPNTNLNLYEFKTNI